MTALLIACLALFAPASVAADGDRVVLQDGRQIEGSLKSESDEQIVLEINGVDIPIRRDLVKELYPAITADYQPKDDKERKYLEKGFVRFEGQWMSKSRYEKELAKRREAEAEELAQLKHDQQWRNRKKFKTKYFSIESNLPEDILDDWVMLLETYYKYFRDYWGIKISPKVARKEKKVFLYRTRDDFFRANPDIPRGVLGYFSSHLGELHIFYDKRNPELSQTVLFHEFNHLLTYLIEPDFSYPIWLNEGMAEYYGTADVNEKGKFTVGGQQDGRLVTIYKDKAEGRLLGVDELLLTERPAFTAREYAYAWSFCHFLMENTEYQKAFRAFFGNLPNNGDISTTKIPYDYGRDTKDTCDLYDVLEAFEKRIGESVEDLEAEWLQWIEQAYDELNPRAYYRAAQTELWEPKPDGSHIVKSVEYFEKAVQLGVDDPECYRQYAEMLRKGGIVERNTRSTPIPVDAPRAFEMIQKAIELDPLNPLFYIEAGGILVMESEITDLDTAAQMAETGLALGAKDPSVQGLYQELVQVVEESREALRKREQRAAELAAADDRVWFIVPHYFEGEEPPERIEDLSTDDLRALIAAGTLDGKDWAFQASRKIDEATGEMVAGSEPWELDYVPLSDIPEFAPDLEAAAGGSDG